MSRARIGNISISHRQIFLAVAGLIMAAIIIGAILVYTPQSPQRYNKSGIQFYNDGKPVGNWVYTGDWLYEGQLVDMAKFRIAWEADVPEDSYVDITFKYGVFDGSSFEHTTTYTGLSRQGYREVTYNLKTISTTGLSNGDVITFGGEVEFAVYSSSDELLNSAGDRIIVRLVYDSGYTNDWVLASITITPYDYFPEDVEP